MKRKSKKSHAGQKDTAAVSISVSSDMDDGDYEVYKGSFFRALLLGLFLGLLLAGVTLVKAANIRDFIFGTLPDRQYQLTNSSESVVQFTTELKKIQKRINGLRAKVNDLIPKSAYLIVDTSNNLIFLMRKSEQIHQGVCSTGSYVQLIAGNQRQWIFKTPRGAFRILQRLQRPVWYMPDWAFIEEGRKVPPRHSPERYEAGVLGKYALDIGKGYLIHGTLYKRFLGMPVTHGCVRLGDEDLEIVYKNLPLGSRVFIY